MQFVVEMTPIK